MSGLPGQRAELRSVTPFRHTNIPFEALSGLVLSAFDLPYGPAAVVFGAVFLDRFSQQRPSWP